MENDEEGVCTYRSIITTDWKKENQNQSVHMKSLELQLEMRSNKYKPTNSSRLLKKDNFID